MQKEEFLRLSRVTGNGENAHRALSQNESLYDSTVLKCAYLIAYGKGKKPTDVRIIEPGIITFLLEPTSEIDPIEFKGYHDLFLPNVPLILIPLHYKNHWSLFYYRSDDNRWVSMDSLPSSSHLHLTALLPNLLFQRGLLSKEMLPTEGIKRFSNLVKQPGGWECGTYTLLFIQMVLTARGGEQEIQERISLLSEKTRSSLCKALQEFLLNTQ